MLFRQPNMNNSLESNVVGNNNYVENEMNVDVNMMQGNMMNGGYGEMGTPQERCIHRTFVHEVPHGCPFM